MFKTLFSKKVRPAKIPVRDHLIFHIGMHKTGSTSIQHALQKHRSEAFHYMRLGQANHSVPLIRLYDPNPFSHFSVTRTGMTAEELAAHRTELDQRITQQLQRRPEMDFVISAEWLSNAPIQSIQQIHDRFAPHFKQISIFGYVRSPASFMNSMFQQAIKTGRCNFTLDWPRYQKRFEHFDTIFGRNNVHLRAYDTDAKLRQDIIADFSNWTGLPLPRETTQIQRNKSMTAAGLALLFHYRRRTDNQAASATGWKTDEALKNALRELQSPRFLLSQDLIDQTITQNSADLDWIDARLGTPLPRNSNTAASDIFYFDGEASIERAAIHFCPLLRGQDAGSLTQQAEADPEFIMRELEEFAKRL